MKFTAATSENPDTDRAVAEITSRASVRRELFPRQLDVSQNGSRVVVTVSSYLGGSWGGQKGQNRIDVIDTSTDKVSASIPLPGTGATGVALSADGDTAYVTDRLGSRLFRVDVEKQRVVSELGVARGSWQVTLREDRDLAYVVCCRPAKSVVTVVNTKNDTVLSQIPVDIVRGTWDARATFAPGSERLYVMHALGSTIAVVDCDPESLNYHKQIELIETQGNGVEDSDPTAARKDELRPKTPRVVAELGMSSKSKRRRLAFLATARVPRTLLSGSFGGTPANPVTWL